MPATETILQTRHEHRIIPKLLNAPVNVVVVGCGGTGSAIVSGLPHLHQAMVAYGHPGGLAVTLVDADRISAANCVRQPFSESEIGLNKAVILASRVNVFWGLRWQAREEYVDERWSLDADIIIGCVDTRGARKKIAESPMYKEASYYLDIGNSADSGQFILGQPANSANLNDPMRLLTAAELFPEIIDPALDRKDSLPSCSAVDALEKQEPFVNQTLAYHALALLARVFRHGSISYHGAFLNLATGKVQPLPIDPAVRARMPGRQKPRRSSRL